MGRASYGSGKMPAQVARGRDGITEHLTVTLKHLGSRPRQQKRPVTAVT